MKTSIFYFSCVLSVLILSCGIRKNDDENNPKPIVNKDIPRWETVDRKELTFKYYVTSSETAFQLVDENIGAVAVQPWLKLKGSEGEQMEFVMMFEAAAPDACKRYAENNDFSWKGIIFKDDVEDYVNLFAETNTVTKSGKQFSLIHFLISKGASETCAKLTYYDINMKGYDHKLSIFDKSELSEAILTIAGSVRLK